MKKEYEYLLNNKNTGMYLRYIKDNDLPHYVRDVQDASIFTLKEALSFLEKYKHPENWVIVKRKKGEKNERFSYPKSKRN